jgi:hypothetical protein
MMKIAAREALLHIMANHQGFALEKVRKSGGGGGYRLTDLKRGATLSSGDLDTVAAFLRRGAEAKTHGKR